MNFRITFLNLPIILLTLIILDCTDCGKAFSFQNWGSNQFLKKFKHEPVTIDCLKCQKTKGDLRDCIVVPKISEKGKIINTDPDVPIGSMLAFSTGRVDHTVVTVGKVKDDKSQPRIQHSGSPEKYGSWFPGYTWTRMICPRKNHLIGWEYNATAGQKLEKFWAFTLNGGVFLNKNNIVEHLKDDDEALWHQRAWRHFHSLFTSLTNAKSTEQRCKK